MLQVLQGRPADADLLIVVDQFEESFTLCTSRTERNQFIAALTTAAQTANSRTRVVLGIRADFYARCAEHPELVDALRDAQLLVGPMNADELRRAISQPAARANATVESALLVRVIADTTGQAGVLPLISHALRETWHRRRGNTLTLAGYEAAGGIAYALAHTADHLYTTLTTAQQRLAKHIFLSLVAPGKDGINDTKRRVNREDLGNRTAVNTVLETLAETRLITLGAGTVEITHEALLTAWPRLRRWLDEDRAGLPTYHHLAAAAETWHHEGRHPSALYRGPRLATATEWAAQNHHGSLQPDERTQEFLTASHHHQRRIVRLRRTGIALLCVLALTASVTAVFAWRQSSAVRAIHNTARAAQLDTIAQGLRDRNPSRAAQYALAAYRIQPTKQRAITLMSTQNTPPVDPCHGLQQGLGSSGVQPRQPHPGHRRCQRDTAVRRHQACSPHRAGEAARGRQRNGVQLQWAHSLHRYQ